jgi:hypothetical protein
VLEREGWQAVWQRVEAHFPDARDRQLLRLVLQGERKTTRFAVVLGLADLDRVSQQREVKRHKDRIAKRLRRLGEEWGATDGQGGPDAG